MGELVNSFSLFMHERMLITSPSLSKNRVFERRGLFAWFFNYIKPPPPLSHTHSCTLMLTLALLLSPYYTLAHNDVLIKLTKWSRAIWRLLCKRRISLSLSLSPSKLKFSPGSYILSKPFVNYVVFKHAWGEFD